MCGHSVDLVFPTQIVLERPPPSGLRVGQQSPTLAVVEGPIQRWGRVVSYQRDGRGPQSRIGGGCGVAQEGVGDGVADGAEARDLVAQRAFAQRQAPSPGGGERSTLQRESSSTPTREMLFY